MNFIELYNTHVYMVIIQVQQLFPLTQLMTIFQSYCSLHSANPKLAFQIFSNFYCFFGNIQFLVVTSNSSLKKKKRKLTLVINVLNILIDSIYLPPFSFFGNQYQLIPVSIIIVLYVNSTAVELMEHCTIKDHPNFSGENKHTLPLAI